MTATNVTRLAVIVALLAMLMLLAPRPMHGQQQATVQKVFSGITAAAASSPVRNIGQSMHILTVLFPAESADVTGLQVRLEASFEGLYWFPISSTITEAPKLGNVVYQIVVAYGPWPYVRVRNLASTPGGKALTAYYAGHVIPAVSAVTETTDRFIL